MGIIYGIADVLWVIIRFVIRYRYQVIMQNIRASFPEKSDAWHKRVAGKFYRHFADWIMETIKMAGMREGQMNSRISFNGLDQFEEHFKNNRSIIVLGMHHNNWEWASFVQKKMNHHLLMLYNPVRRNYELENFLIGAREKWGGQCIPVHQSARKVLEFNANRIPTVLWLGADQTPPANSQFWTMFLNREAPFFQGPEKIAIRTNQPVYFHHTRKIGRGRYEVTLTCLFDKPADVAPKEILLAYVRKMEEAIAEEPESYLWSHRRWKHIRPESIPLTS